MRWPTLTLVAVCLTAPATAAGPERAPGTAGPRWLPELCRAELELAGGEPSAPGETAEERWNRHYRRGYEAVAAGDLDTAERSLCKALAAARGFGPRDVRFAETLDELGLAGYMREDDARAEAMQGAAVAEMLLALGPPPDRPAEKEADCRSSVRTYLTRLGWVYARQGRAEDAEKLQREPYRVLGLGYVPAESLEPRLEWLISQYLLAEDLAAAGWLSELREELRRELAGHETR